MATSLDEFLPLIINPDTKRRMTTYDDLIKYLSDQDNSTECEDLNALVEGINGWIDSSNYKISQYGMEIIASLIERINDEFRNHITTVLPHIVDRLGDNKDPVRQAARGLILKLMAVAQSPQYVMERLTPSFGHKLWRVREELCLCVQQALVDYGAKAFSLSKMLPAVCKLLEDANAPVRDAATLLLVDMYRQTGERLRVDIMKREIHPSKLAGLLAKMDEVRDNGAITDNDDGVDDVDFAKPQAPKVMAAKRQTKSAGPSTSRTQPAAASGKETGAVDKETFMKAFEDVGSVMIFSGRDVADKMSRIRDTLSDGNLDWEKRMDALREIRSLLFAGAKEYDEFSQHLKTFNMCLITSVKDLRSQVVREACFTIAYLSQELLNKFDTMAEVLLPTLIGQIPNSAKIMSTSASYCIRFILQHTHAPRLIPIIASQLTSKAAVIRRECCDFIDLVLRMWPTHNLEKHIALLQDAIRKGISDADSDARQISRRAFWAFAEHFRDQAESLRNSLDPVKQKQLEGAISNASSNNSLHNAGTSKPAVTSKIRSLPAPASRIRSVSTERGNGTTTANRQLLLPGAAKTRGASDSTDGREDADAGIVRCSSAVDLARTQANARSIASASANPTAAAAASRTNYYSLRQTKSTVDLTGSPPTRTRIPQLSRALSVCQADQTRPRKAGPPAAPVTNTRTTQPSPAEHRRTKTRPGVSQSQPGSRSGSPSSRIPQLGVTPVGHQRRQTSGIPRSQGASREASPNRYGFVGHERRPSIGMSDTLQQAALRLQQPRRNGDQDYDDNASETSSVCSERSFSSRGYMADDMAEVIKLLTSGSWADRKEGLMILQSFVQTNRQLTRSELKRLTEIFTRMFHDPHGKVLSVFFDTIVELVAVYKFELLDWLTTLLTRLLNKMGADMLGSVLAKVQKALDAVRDAFPIPEQFTIITRLIIDQSQTPNVKLYCDQVKAAILNYVGALTVYMSPSDFVNNSDTRLAVSRIITWTTEPKSTEVRKAAQAVLIALFNHNTPEFSMLLTGLPKTFQEGATKILQSHMRGDGSAPPMPFSPTRDGNMTRSQHSSYSYRNRADDMGTENMNPEDIYQSIRQTSADIQNLSLWDGGSSSGYEQQSTRNTGSYQANSGVAARRRSSGGDSGGANYQEVRDTHRYGYDPQQYQGMGGRSATAPVSLITKQEFPDDMMSTSDTVADIIAELSMHNARHEERKTAMLQLIKLCRTDQSEEVWMEHFKNVLLLLLETLGDDDAHIRALALRVLREMLRTQAERFRGYLELTTLKVLEAHRDTEKEVTRSAEECAATLTSVVNTDQCLHVLGPVIATAQFPVCLAAIKMATKAIEQAPREAVLSQLKNLVPGVLKGYDNSESSVRKASVFCLVALHSAVGDDLYAYLKELNGSKLKLLNLYIKRAAGEREQMSAATSMTSSPTPAFSDIQ